MLLIALIAAWLTLTTLIVAVCRVAAIGDRMSAAAPDLTPGRTIAEGLVVWDDRPPAFPRYDARLRAVGALTQRPG